MVWIVFIFIFVVYMLYSILYNFYTSMPDDNVGILNFCVSSTIFHKITLITSLFLYILNLLFLSFCHIYRDVCIYSCIVTLLLNKGIWVRKFNINSALVEGFCDIVNYDLFYELNLISESTLIGLKNSEEGSLCSPGALELSDSIFKDSIFHLFYFPVLIKGFHLLFGMYSDDSIMYHLHKNKHFSISDNIEVVCAKDNFTLNPIFLMEITFDLIPEDFSLLKSKPLLSIYKLFIGETFDWDVHNVGMAPCIIHPYIFMTLYIAVWI